MVRNDDGPVTRVSFCRTCEAMCGVLVDVEGDLDFRGTLGVDKEAPVGFREIRLHFDLVSDAPQEDVDTLVRLTERYCVVLQTLAGTPTLSTTADTTRP